MRTLFRADLIGDRGSRVIGERFGRRVRDRAAGLGLACAAIVTVLLAAGAVSAELGGEPLHRNTELPAAGPHWVWTADLDLNDLATSRFMLVDPEAGRVRGMLRTGAFPTLMRSPDGRHLYVSESWSRGPEQVREDFLTIYDAGTLRIDEVIELPGPRRALMSPRDRAALTNDGDLVVVFNFTPATSLTVVDVAARRVVGSVPTPGCSLVYPTGDRGVSMICGDGSLLTVHFDASGGVRAQHRSEPFFDPDVDPVIENAARMGDRWLFTTYGGMLHDVDLSGERPVFSDAWPLVDQDAEPAGFLATLFTMGRAGPWKPGGYQLMSAHAGTGRLFVLMHPVTWSEGKGDHVFPGAEVWVYDVASRERVDRIGLRDVAISIHVTEDEDPVLVAGAIEIETEAPGLEIYDVDSGRFLSDLPEPGPAKLYLYGAGPR